MTGKEMARNKKLDRIADAVLEYLVAPGPGGASWLRRGEASKQPYKTEDGRNGVAINFAANWMLDFTPTTATFVTLEHSRSGITVNFKHHVNKFPSQILKMSREIRKIVEKEGEHVGEFRFSFLSAFNPDLKAEMLAQIQLRRRPSDYLGRLENARYRDVLRVMAV
jgi:hypothetical protein